MSNVLVLVAIVMLPISFFTWWGWVHILKPVGWPLLKYAWKTTLFMAWFLFAVGVGMLGQVYRIWGFNLESISCGLDDNPALCRRQIEATTNPEGWQEFQWRQNRGLEMLPLLWDGENPPIEHLLPGWTILLIPAGILFVRRRNKKAAKTQIVRQYHTN